MSELGYSNEIEGAFFLIVCGQYSKLLGPEKMGAAGRSGNQQLLSKSLRLCKTSLRERIAIFNAFWCWHTYVQNRLTVGPAQGDSRIKKEVYESRPSPETHTMKPEIKRKKERQNGTSLFAWQADWLHSLPIMSVWRRPHPSRIELYSKFRCSPSFSGTRRSQGFGNSSDGKW